MKARHQHVKLKVIEMETVCLHFWQHIKHPRWALAHHTIRLLDEGVPQDAPPQQPLQAPLKSVLVVPLQQLEETFKSKYVNPCKPVPAKVPRTAVLVPSGCLPTSALT